ncbi:hypothetical protein ACF08B_28460 [Streptomyces sp. NPDC015139]|uniref:hypothetical protein n=1 Tax=Streptomyces sp. NPDC015139 TaxID=3364942 RepID=UPI0036FDF248
MQAFACALKRLIPHVEPGATMEVKAALLAISPSLLSHWLSGRRLPVPTALNKLYDLAAEGALRTTNAVLSCSFAELEGLLRAARRSTCRRCHGDCACHDGEGDRRNGSARSSGSRSAADSGDRRNGSPTEARRQGAALYGADLAERLAGLPLADQVNLLWSLGAALKEEEIGAVVKELADAGMHQEMEVLLRAAESSGRDSVKIVIAFSATR